MQSSSPALYLTTDLEYQIQWETYSVIVKIEDQAMKILRRHQDNVKEYLIT